MKILKPKLLRDVTYRIEFDNGLSVCYDNQVCFADFLFLSPSDLEIREIVPEKVVYYPRFYDAPLDRTTINKWLSLVRTIHPQVTTHRAINLSANLPKPYILWVMRLVRMIEEQPQAVENSVWLHRELGFDPYFSILSSQFFCRQHGEIRYVHPFEYEAHRLFPYRSTRKQHYLAYKNYRGRLKKAASYAKTWPKGPRERGYDDTKFMLTGDKLTRDEKTIDNKCINQLRNVEEEVFIERLNRVYKYFTN